MNEYESFIKGMLAKGVNPEAIAAEFSNAMNEVEKKDGKQEYLDSLEDSITEAINSRHISVSDVADIATWAVAIDNHPEWTLEQCKAFHKYISMCLTEGADLIGKSFEDVMKKTLGDVLGQAVQKKQEVVTKDRDFESIKNFFKEIGLGL